MPLTAEQLMPFLTPYTSPAQWAEINNRMFGQRAEERLGEKKLAVDKTTAEAQLAHYKAIEKQAEERAARQQEEDDAQKKHWQDQADAAAAARAAPVYARYLNAANPQEREAAAEELRVLGFELEDFSPQSPSPPPRPAVPATAPPEAAVQQSVNAPQARVARALATAAPGIGAGEPGAMASMQAMVARTPLEPPPTAPQPGPAPPAPAQNATTPVAPQVRPDIAPPPDIPEEAWAQMSDAEKIEILSSAMVETQEELERQRSEPEQDPVKQEEVLKVLADNVAAYQQDIAILQGGAPQQAGPAAPIPPPAAAAPLGPPPGPAPAPRDIYAQAPRQMRLVRQRDRSPVGAPFSPETREAEIDAQQGRALRELLAGVPAQDYNEALSAIRTADLAQTRTAEGRLKLAMKLLNDAVRRRDYREIGLARNAAAEAKEQAQAEKDRIALNRQITNDAIRNFRGTAKDNKVREHVDALKVYEQARRSLDEAVRTGNRALVEGVRFGIARGRQAGNAISNRDIVNVAAIDGFLFQLEDWLSKQKGVPNPTEVERLKGVLDDAFAQTGERVVAQYKTMKALRDEQPTDTGWSAMDSGLRSTYGELELFFEKARQQDKEYQHRRARGLEPAQQAQEGEADEEPTYNEDEGETESEGPPAPTPSTTKPKTKTKARRAIEGLRGGQ